MFKNKFFSKNNELNRKFINGLKKLSEQSDRLQELERQLEQIKNQSGDAKDESKTSDDSLQTIPKTCRGQLQDQKQQISYQHARYYLFVKKMIGRAFTNEKLQQNQIPQVNLQNLKKQQKSEYIEKIKIFIEDLVTKQKKFIDSVCKIKCTNRIKYYFLYRMFDKNLKQLQKTQPNFQLVVREFLIDVLRSKIILDTKSRFKNKKKFVEIQNIISEKNSPNQIHICSSNVADLD